MAFDRDPPGDTAMQVDAADPSAVLRALRLGEVAAKDLLHPRQRQGQEEQHEAAAAVSAAAIAAASPFQVRFDPKAQLVLIPSRHDMSERSMREYWNTDEDSERIEVEMIRTIRYMRSTTRGCGTERDRDLCTRGLEHMKSPEHLERRNAHKRKVIRVVLRAQEKQWAAGLQYDPESISRASCQVSVRARDLALTLALADEAYVQRAHKRILSTGVPLLQTRQVPEYIGEAPDSITAVAQQRHRRLQPQRANQREEKVDSVGVTQEEGLARASSKLHQALQLSMSSLAAETVDSLANSMHSRSWHAGQQRFDSDRDSGHHHDHHQG